jgi:hypothetical protein
MIYELWCKIRPHKRLWTVQKIAGIVTQDDRTLLEKIRDWGDVLIVEPHRERKWRAAEFRRQGFKPFFDMATGRWINSSAEIRMREKAGEFLASHREMKEYHAKKKAETHEAYKRKLRASLDQAVKEVKQGRSFKREIYEATRRANG